MSLPEHIVALSPSENASRAMLGLVRQISKRDGISEQELFSSSEIVEICSREKLGRKDKLKLLRNLLENQRYPLKAKLEAELSQCSKEILKDLGIKLELPVEFEGDSVSFQIKAKTLEQIDQASERVSELSKHPAMSRIFAVLAGEFSEEEE